MVVIHIFIVCLYSMIKSSCFCPRYVFSYLFKLKMKMGNMSMPQIGLQYSIYIMLYLSVVDFDDSHKNILTVGI